MSIVAINGYGVSEVDLMGSWLSTFAQKAKQNVAAALNKVAQTSLEKGIPGVTAPVTTYQPQKPGVSPVLIGGVAAGLLVLILALRK